MGQAKAQSKSEIAVRKARVSDASTLADIYNHEVQSSSANYATAAQTVDERRLWIAGLLEKNYPVRVAERNGEIVGFGALTPFHALAGYRFTVTALLYVADGHRRAGVGRLIANELLEAAAGREYHTILAGVNAENEASIGLLESFGFERVGRFRQIGRKNGRWHDDVCLQKILKDDSINERKEGTT